MTKTLVEKFSLRFRIFLFFALIVLGALAIIVGAMMLAAQRIGDDATPPLVLFGGAAVFAICGLTLWVWLKFDENVAIPIERLSRDLRSIAYGQAVHKVDEDSLKYLGFLAPATRDVVQTLAESRSQVDNAIQNALHEVELQKSRLEIVLRDLQEAVLICTLDHKILLYNRRALEILHISGDLGLNRSLFQVVAAKPFLHALERLTTRFDSRRYQDHHEGLSTLVVSSTLDGEHILQGRVSLFLNVKESKPLGYVATFSDVTRELNNQAKCDNLLNTITTRMRGPLTSILASTDLLIRNEELSVQKRKTLQSVLKDEATTLGQHLKDIETEVIELLGQRWPMSDVYSATIFQCAIGKSHISKEAVTLTDQQAWLYCDSLTISELICHLIRQLLEKQNIKQLSLSTSQIDQYICLQIAWRGEPIVNAQLDKWLDVELDIDMGHISGQDVLDRHRTELWSVTADNGEAKIQLPLRKAKEHFKHEKKVRLVLPERPEFYDFDLLERMDTSSINETPLAQATYVVFDTETTGLEPSKGDEIVSIAGIRIVNGRILRGEIFNELVNPGRRIPKLATQVHGISDAMVKNAPDICTILKRFEQFVGDAVLVAHNAAFDMKFLTLKQSKCGTSFDNPVLDTVLLAAQVHGSSDSLTLDTLSARYGIELLEKDRHTALGDAIATAEVFLRLIKLLKSTLHVHTVQEAILTSNEVAEIRRQQSKAY